MPSRGALLIGLCIGAVLARIATAALLPNVAHPDETFQYLEQAYRLSTGRGLVPWEYVVGARSWILPGLIAPVVKAAVLLSPSPAVHLWAVTLFMVVVSVCGLIAAFALGERAGGLTHGFFAGLLAAIWCELVYLSPHVLADTLSAVPLIAALTVVYRVDAPGFRRMVLAGTLFGLAFVFRIQLAPAIGLAMLSICGREIRSRTVPMAVGFAGPLLVMGLVDWVALGAPFRSVLVYILVNQGGVANSFGTAPLFDYLLRELDLWGPATPLILVTAGLGARRLPLLAFVAATILVTFSFIGHKEYRFIYPALPLLFVLCGVGTADLISWLAAKHIETGVLAAAALWLMTSALVGGQAPMQRKWHQQIGWLTGFQRINADAAACGVGIDPADAWFLTGYVRLRPDLDLFDGTPSAPSAAYNYRLAATQKTTDDGAFHTLGCAGVVQRVCIYKRAGGCEASAGRRLSADPGDEVTAVLLRLGLVPH